MKRVDHWLIPTHVLLAVLYPYLYSEFAPGKVVTSPNPKNRVGELTGNKRLQHPEGLRAKEPLGLHDKMAFEARQSSVLQS